MTKRRGLGIYYGDQIDTRNKMNQKVMNRRIQVIKQIKIKVFCNGWKIVNFKIIHKKYRST